MHPCDLQQLRLWHKNQDRKRRSTRKLSTLLGAVGVTKRAGRLPQARELFSQEYYKSDIQPLVEASRDEMEAALGRKLKADERLSNVKKCTQQAFDAAPEAVRRDIQKRLRKAKEDRQAGRTGRTLELDSARTPQQYQE